MKCPHEMSEITISHSTTSFSGLKFYGDPIWDELHILITKEQDPWQRLGMVIHPVIM